ncbi:MSHA biogenesis protein MshK [Shewanella oneidensis MR-1]|uniref:MSHA biogenesis protein MshK n=1 Tax=Shewanella oneidensis (strain ATCC 700550 / JCM 31522 / CIP 106686 / LMG 19005 / NCIMB 14063 / MR-1) TaxID=211586 RepID=Q8E9Z6_SHEON|nr:MSHA biogenesis protein MshK [Shewanella oneidensis]AAN57087.1 MSHA biogenesis protein MshK [Shewanella oneidensis MR-1]MDX5998583.1 MSHA biogenesis protein MshK [Shewanella oneidensis]MEE2026612.1 hypothetical protein [Shewanella oneidensis]QKG98364.1 MSHA biogenesis protein MshK [Shewanella oneidensis MR-1]
MLLNKSYIFIALLGISAQVSAESLRDPTLPGKGYSGAGAVSQNQHQALILNSIVSSGNTAYAVINNKIVSVGDSIQGVKVVRITPASVSLSDGRKLAVFQAIIER